jgi:hypothetical protein
MPTAVFYRMSVPPIVPSVVYMSLCPLWSSRFCPRFSVPYTVPYVGSVSLCPLLCSRVCPLSVSTSHCTVCWFYVTMSTAVFYNLSVTPIVSSFGSMSLCPLLYSRICPRLSVLYTVPSVGSVSLYRLLSFTVCPLSLSMSQCNVCCFCVTMSSAVHYSLSTVCQFLTLPVSWFCVTMPTDAF